ncbi:MAG: hypothetical protein A3E77_18665 [Sphingopyxis sp. RIFCSPHIGHO2_12_FULL_65_19]|nr:MAG: hypothetical protein A3E77_18665 [Sphingopyxis sp. RIFCSPHIGHO2_12_FULL_65_19]
MTVKSHESSVRQQTSPLRLFHSMDMRIKHPSSFRRNFGDPLHYQHRQPVARDTTIQSIDGFISS